MLRLSEFQNKSREKLPGTPLKFERGNLLVNEAPSKCSHRNFFQPKRGKGTGANKKIDLLTQESRIGKKYPLKMQSYKMNGRKHSEDSISSERSDRYHKLRRLAFCNYKTATVGSLRDVNLLYCTDL